MEWLTQITSQGFHHIILLHILIIQQSTQEKIIRIGIFIAGAGNVDSNKISVSFPEYIIKNDAVEVIDFNYENNTPVSHYMRGHYIGTVPGLFTEVENSPILENVGSAQLFDVVAKKFSAPVTFKFKIDEHAPSGDHVISIILSYKYREQWYASEKNINIHVRYWYETDFFYKVSAILISLSITSSILSIIDFFKKRSINYENISKSAINDEGTSKRTRKAKK